MEIFFQNFQKNPKIEKSFCIILQKCSKFNVSKHKKNTCSTGTAPRPQNRRHLWGRNLGQCLRTASSTIWTCQSPQSQTGRLRLLGHFGYLWLFLCHFDCFRLSKVRKCNGSRSICQPWCLHWGCHLTSFYLIRRERLYFCFFWQAHKSGSKMNNFYE